MDIGPIYQMDGWTDNLPGNCPISGVASCLISSALAMRQLPQKLQQIWNVSYQEIICTKHGKLL